MEKESVLFLQRVLIKALPNMLLKRMMIMARIHERDLGSLSLFFLTTEEQDLLNKIRSTHLEPANQDAAL